MASIERESKVPTGLSTLPRGLVCFISITLGVLGLVFAAWYLFSPRRVGCIVLTGGNLVIALPFALLAISTGHVSRFKPGYWSGYACIILILLSFVIPPVKSPGPVSKGAMAVGLLRTINTAEITYASTYNIGYSPSLSCLAPSKGNPTAKAAGLVDSVLAGAGNTSEYSGYRFVYSPGPRDEKGHISSYSVTASPIQPEVTGTYYFFTDQTGVIRQNSTGPAGPKDPPLAG